MTQYGFTLTGTEPGMLHHRDNLGWADDMKAWRDTPENKKISVPGDDRSPAWTWIGCLYHDGKTIGIDSDCLMTMLREGGNLTPTGKTRGDKSFKKSTQSGLMVDQILVPLDLGNGPVPLGPINALIGDHDFQKHCKVAQDLGFELFVKRARLNRGSKNVRVRPLFRRWTCTGSITVFDEQVSGLTEKILLTILKQAGALCGLGDWRPSQGASGPFGRFVPEVWKM